MSSNVPGISFETLNTGVSVQGAPANAIAVIGHVGATLPAGVREFTAIADGDILEYTSLTDALTGLGGKCDGTGWNAGVVDVGVGASSPYDSKDNLLRAIDLIYAGNSGAKVYVFPLDGVGDPLTGTTAIPNGAQRALDVMLDIQDIGFFILANIDPIAAGKSHAELAASKDKTYNSPRFYATGIDMYTVWDATNNGGAAPPLAAADLAFMSTVKSSIGLVLNYIGNHEYNFSRVVDSIVPTDVTVEIGGQLAAAWLAGVLSAQSANFGVTNYPALAIPKWNGNNYIFKTDTELNDAIGEGFIITRFKNNAYVLAKGVTYTSDISWELYPKRQITNTIHKTVAINLDQFLGKPITTGMFIGAQTVVDGILGNAKSSQLITTYSSTVKQHPTKSDALKVELEIDPVDPANNIDVSMTVG